MDLSAEPKKTPTQKFYSKISGHPAPTLIKSPFFLLNIGSHMENENKLILK